MPQRETIRGYGGLFRRDWRIYSIPDGKGGRKPVPFTGGLPIRTILYFAVAWLVVFALTRLPVIGLPLTVFDWPIRYVAIPGIVAFVLTKAEPDGRPAVRYLGSWLAHRLAARCRSAGRPVPAEGEVAVYEPRMAIAANGEGPTLVASLRRRGRYLARPFTPGLSCGKHDTVATTVELEAGETLEVTA
jgi:TcpE family